MIVGRWCCCCCCCCVVCWLHYCPTSMNVYLRHESARTVVSAATLRRKLQIKVFTSPPSQYTGTGSTSPSADPIIPGAWLGSHRATSFKSLLSLDLKKRSAAKAGIEPRSAALEAEASLLGLRVGGLPAGTPSRRPPCWDSESEASLLGLRGGGLPAGTPRRRPPCWDSEAEASLLGLRGGQ